MYIKITLLSLFSLHAIASEAQWYLGEWEIKEVHFPGITAMTEQEANFLIGEKIIYTNNSARLIDETCQNPTYESEYIYNDGLSFDMYTLDRLELYNFPIEMISVRCNSNYIGLGSKFIIKDDHSIFTFWDGAFFLATKKGM